MKLYEYFEKYGVSKKWFAEKIGIQPNNLYDMVKIKKRIPEKHMKKILKATEGKVTIQEMMEQNLEMVERIESQNKEAESS